MFWFSDSIQNSTRVNFRGDFRAYVIVVLLIPFILFLSKDHIFLSMLLCMIFQTYRSAIRLDVMLGALSSTGLTTREQLGPSPLPPTD